MDLSRAVWRKASRSTSNGGECVEVAGVPGTVAIRDSKDPSGPRLIMTPDDFRRLAEELKHT
ncbi:DUF397 domain-containing protein [Actinomadura sp. 7K507]|uniref:DUF397 domain-containing protein n=1 Tax=Actinomadura sp. 7K507 TaxID=2530365 RepID=UPI001047450F|nr:DUF397 domain-containing protein [Actinomadura sp. 7K507]TDC81718.1 DUF397 domain-containing protein [Actinomadura sp. 7K507]